MPLFELYDAKHNVICRITHRGELVVAPISYSTPYFSVVGSATISTIVPAEAGKRFVITGLIVATNKTFGVPTIAETIIIYEANPADLSVNLNTIVNLDMVNNDRLTATGLNLITEASVSLVASATDDSVNVTLAGYYVVEEEDENDLT